MGKKQPDPLDKFGQFVMSNLRDRGIDFFDTLAKGGWKAPALKGLQEDLARMTNAQRSVVRRSVVRALDAAIHDFLFALQESRDRKEGVECSVDGENVAGLSDGLQGEPFGRHGWQAKHSKHGAAPEKP
jgi:hypothetical protein